MKTVKALIRQVVIDIDPLRDAITNNNIEMVLPYIDPAQEYLLAPDFQKAALDNLNEVCKEAFYLFVLMNELHHYRFSSKNFLMNAAMNLPIDTSVYRRLKLFSKLAKMNHIQNQYKDLFLTYLEEANSILSLSDPYICNESVRLLLLNYFATFMQKAKECFTGMGQAAELESILPEIMSRLVSNQFAARSMKDLLLIIKGTFYRENIAIKFLRAPCET